MLHSSNGTGTKKKQKRELSLCIVPFILCLFTITTIIFAHWATSSNLEHQKLYATIPGSTEIMLREQDLYENKSYKIWSTLDLCSQSKLWTPVYKSSDSSVSIFHCDSQFYGPLRALYFGGSSGVEGVSLLKVV